jgi:UDPglucose 6-dehydrogenase
VREAMRTPLIVDGRNLLDPADVRAAGFVYEGIGRSSIVVAELTGADEPVPELAPRRES